MTELHLARPHLIGPLASADSLLALMSLVDLERLPPEERMAVSTVQIEALEQWLAAYLDPDTVKAGEDDPAAGDLPAVLGERQYASAQYVHNSAAAGLDQHGLSVHIHVAILRIGDFAELNGFRQSGANYHVAL